MGEEMNRTANRSLHGALSSALAHSAHSSAESERERERERDLDGIVDDDDSIGDDVATPLTLALGGGQTQSRPRHQQHFSNSLVMDPVLLSPVSPGQHSQHLMHSVVDSDVEAQHHPIPVSPVPMPLMEDGTENDNGSNVSNVH